MASIWNDHYGTDYEQTLQDGLHFLVFRKDAGNLTAENEDKHGDQQREAIRDHKGESRNLASKGHVVRTDRTANHAANGFLKPKRHHEGLRTDSLNDDL